MNRTEGALVRVITFVPDPMLLDEADKRLEEFIRAVDPKLAYHLPREAASFRDAQAVNLP